MYKWKNGGGGKRSNLWEGNGGLEMMLMLDSVDEREREVSSSMGLSRGIKVDMIIL